MIRRVATRLLAAPCVARLGRAFAPGGSAVLAYHNIVPDDHPPEGDRSLHLPLGAFLRQLDLLGRDYEVVPLDALLSEPPRRWRRPRVAITFDDAYRGTLALGVPELVRRRMPATIFVPPGLLGRDAFWWDAYAGPDGLDAAFRHIAIVECRGEDEAVRWRAGEMGLAATSPPPMACPATLAELASAAARPGITLGAHAWDHANLAALPDAELMRQLRLPLGWLRDRLPNVMPWLSYPYGLSSERVEVRAAEAGYDAALRIGGGAWARGGPAPGRHRIPRVNVPAEVSPGAFLLRTAGLVGA